MTMEEFVAMEEFETQENCGHDDKEQKVLG